MGDFINLPDHQAGAIVRHPTFATLPTGLPVGSVRYAEDTANVYKWNGTAWGSMGGVDTSGFTGDRVVITEADKDLTTSSVTVTELGYLGGVTSAIQTQLGNKQPLDADLTALAALSTTGVMARTAANTYTMRTLTAGSNKVAITDGDGVLGNPTLDVTEANLTHDNIGGTLGIAKGGTGQTAANAAYNALSPTTTRGDITYRNATVNARLAIGTVDQVLKTDGTDPSWGKIVNANVDAAAAVAYSKLAALTVDRALVSNGSGVVTVATTTATEIGYVNGVTSAIQTQLDGKQPLDADLTALAALSTTGMMARTGANTYTMRTITAGSSKISMTNGDGVSGNPTIDVAESNLSHANIGGTTAIANGGTGQTTASAAFDALSPLTTRGDIIFRNATTCTRLPKGTSGQYLKIGANDPEWADVSAGGPNPYAALVNVSSNVTLTASSTHLVDTSAARSLALPTPASGLVLCVKDKSGTAGTNNITITRAGSEQIEGVAASRVLSADWGSWIFFSDGTNWFML